MSDFMRLLVTGSRSWKRDTPTTNGRTIDEILDATAAIAVRSGFAGLLVVHGAAPGVDSVADGWVRTRRHRGWPVDVERHAVSGSDWKTKGIRAGIDRNRVMVGLGAYSCYAFIAPCRSPRCRRPEPHGSHGATNCADLAEGAEIHVQRFNPDLAVQRPETLPLTLPDSKE